MSTFVIGDPHGQALLLERLLARLPIRWETDTLVVLGDVIDRGPASQNVITTLKADSLTTCHSAAGGESCF